MPLVWEAACGLRGYVSYVFVPEPQLSRRTTAHVLGNFQIGTEHQQKQLQGVTLGPSQSVITLECVKTVNVPESH